MEGNKGKSGCLEEKNKVIPVEGQPFEFVILGILELKNGLFLDGNKIDIL